MKLLEQFKSVAKDSDYSKFDALVRAGLANKNQLQKLHRILDKMKEEKPTFNSSERMLLQLLFNRMVDLLSSDKQIFQKAKQSVSVSEETIMENREKDFSEDPPYVLVLKRKQIRMFSNKTKVALYYNQKLDRYFTVPYGDNINANIQAEDHKSAIVQLNLIMDEPVGIVEHQDGSKTKVDNFTARIILEMYDVVNEDNQKNIAKMLSESNDSFLKISQFAYSCLE